ncbi:MAG: preprotein translocase subunit SecG [Actinomycetaceae bacterium]|nr:preprotein translocase subunit SecG [Actinomycetaceae bacterium]
MGVLLIVLKVLVVLTSIFLILTILMHKGKGGGLSDMFGGGLTSSSGSSGVAERNLNRITIGTLVVWTGVIVAIGILQRFMS